jgi:hypothetical protein
VAQLQLDGDRAAYLRREEAIPATNDDPHGLERARRIAWARGDFNALEQVLADPRLPLLNVPGGIYRMPASLEHSLVAWLRNREDDARKFADTAGAELAAMSPTPRQEPWHRIYLGLAEALAGRRDSALRLTREGAEQAIARDQLSGGLALMAAANNYLVLDQPDAAFEYLQRVAVQPCELVPELLRADPVWSRVKSDPRFEKILRSIKPL